MTTPILRLAGHKAAPSAVLFSSRLNWIISTSQDRTVRIWDAGSGALVHCIDDMDPGTHQAVMIWALSPDGETLATGVADFSTKVYSLGSGTRIARLSPLLKVKYNSAEGLAFSADGSQLASVKGQKIEIFETATWTTTHNLKGHTSKISDVQFSPRGRFLATVGGKQLRYWDTNSGSEILSLVPHKKQVYACGFSPSGEHTGEVFHIRFSPDGQWVASWQLNVAADWRLPASGEFHLWNSKTQEVVWRYSGYTEIEFSLDGHWLVMAPENEDVVIVETSSGKVRHRLPPSPLATFSPDGACLLTAEGHDLVLWKL